MIEPEWFERMEIIGKVGTAFVEYLRQNPVGRAGVGADFHPENDSQTVYSFDVAVVLVVNKHATGEDAAPFMPDIAVDVQRPNERLKPMLDRAKDYLANGVRVVILIYPAKRIVEMLTPDISDLFIENDTLTIDLLPGFAVPIKSLFSGV